MLHDAIGKFWLALYSSFLATVKSRPAKDAFASTHEGSNESLGTEGGDGALSWISAHVCLKEKGLDVDTATGRKTMAWILRHMCACV